MLEICFSYLFDKCGERMGPRLIDCPYEYVLLFHTSVEGVGGGGSGKILKLNRFLLPKLGKESKPFFGIYTLLRVYL